MEAAAAAASSSVLLSFSSPRRSTAATFLRLSTASPRITCSTIHQLPLAAPWLLTAEKSSSRRSSILSLRCSSAAAGSPSAVVSSERWILEPAGDGDWKHIGYRVARPGAIEIASEAMTVGRVPENADVVIPVATVSGVHARLEKKDGNLVAVLPGGNGHGQHQRHLRQREEAGAGIPGRRPTREPPHLR